MTTLAIGVLVICGVAMMVAALWAWCDPYDTWPDWPTF